jgi:hypothetical protein
MSALCRNDEVNAGRTTKVRGAKKADLAWISLDEADTHTIYVDVTPLDRAVATPVITVTWGHGGASIERTHRMGGLFVASYAASMIRIVGRLEAPGGQPVGDGVECEFRAAIARGLGEALGIAAPRTEWIAQVSGDTPLAVGARRLLTVEAYYREPPASSNLLWVLFFDATEGPRVGDAPVLACLLPAFPEMVRRVRPCTFTRGIVWALSTSPTLFSPTFSSVLVHVDAEVAL